MEAFAEEFAVLPQRYGGHLWLSVLAILTGLAISLPAGILAARNKHIATPALSFANTVQTIPGLALLALMVPVLGGRIGFWPVYVALTLYSMLPILRNTIVGLQGVPADVREAALGVGMTPIQRLMQVDLPLASPIMVAGLRTASVWVVGAATLSTPVGYESLGNYIFSGLQIRDWGMVLFGCIASAVLALSLDQAIRLFELAARDRKRGFAIGGLVSLVVIALPSFAGGLLTPNSSTAPTEIAETGPSSLAGQSITIGAKPFTEQFILAMLLQRVLGEEGVDVSLRENLGSTIAFDALRTNEIDLYVEYTGTVWASVMKRDAPVPRARMYTEVSAFLWNQHGVLSLDKLGFENAYAFAMDAVEADEMNVTRIDQIAPIAADLTKGGDVEFFARSEWTRTRDAYGLQALKTRGMDSTFMYEALRNGEVDLITAYTTDGRIDAYNLVLLDDPLQALPPYDAFIMLAPDQADNGLLHAALGRVSGKISNSLMRQANAKVDLDKQSPREAADWLYEQITAP